MTSRVLLGTNQPPTIEEQNVAKEGDFDWLDEDGDLELHWDDEVDDVNVKNTDELVKWREIEISTSVGEDFSEAISDVLNQIDLEGEKDFVESEDELKSIGSSSDIEGENSLLVYKEGDEKKHGFHYKVGMIFSSNSQFKWVVEVHEAVNNKSIKFTKNDKRRVQAKCRVNHCNWAIFASRSNPSCPFTIKSFGKHTCGAQQKNKTINSRFLSKYYKEEFKDNENWGRREFQKKVKRTFRCNVSKYQSYRARRNAKKSLIGTQSEQFNMLWDYCEELRISNPGTTVMMKLDTTDREGSRCRFLRLYVCFAACKQGFLAGCRQLIGIDGCHLKGFQKGGQLLAAVGVDANNCMFPIAFAVVESEAKETWKWFLQFLASDLEIHNNPYGWTLISDKQKGLVQAVEEVLPNVSHRNCVRHLHQNFTKDGFGGQVLKRVFWAACKATTQPEFKQHIEAMQVLNPKAAEWVSERSPLHFCRAFFDTSTKSDMLLNNLCESFNSSILNARDKHIVTMVECLRIYLMKRMQHNRDTMRNNHVKICPKIVKIIEQNKEKICGYIAYKSNDEWWQVEDDDLKLFRVHLTTSSCSCRRWDLTGIPCVHAISAIFENGQDPIEYTNWFYSVEAYLKSYEPAIMPISSSDQWRKTGAPPPLPPKYKPQPGRPKKLRRKDPIEKEHVPTKLGRIGEKKKCGLCGQHGHNKRRCKASKEQQQEHVQQPLNVQNNMNVDSSVQHLVEMAIRTSQAPPLDTESTQEASTSATKKRSRKQLYPKQKLRKQ
ncbi:uncharacterized protein LOC116027130 isoform X2 [Ipomoea triloba]|uniref:uncharacterized protein LOC116027130 isoform X2 n=1 Tax=Ipomoea triloba TaxID=35885 RepID=UPI00125D6496|nr:uncharacterized protein LOC116027130 isoform X2 [Ipomoea triloba]